MAVDVAPETADAVEITVAVAVDEIHAVGGRDHQRLVVQPQFHVSEGMPEVLFVEFLEFHFSLTS
jgi:hypothetical protein